MSDRSVSEVLDEAKIQFADNRIQGIWAELDHALKIQVAQAIGIDADHILLGDHLFYQAGRETVGTVLMSEEFTKLQVAADKEVSELRKTVTERGALRDLVNGTLSELRMEALLRKRSHSTRTSSPTSLRICPSLAAQAAGSSRMSSSPGRNKRGW